MGRSLVAPAVLPPVKRLNSEFTGGKTAGATFPTPTTSHPARRLSCCRKAKPMEQSSPQISAVKLFLQVPPPGLPWTGREACPTKNVGANRRNSRLPLVSPCPARSPVSLIPRCWDAERILHSSPPPAPD